MVGGENIRASIGFELRLHVDGIIERHPWNSKRPCQARIKRELASCEIIRGCLKKKRKKGNRSGNAIDGGGESERDNAIDLTQLRFDFLSDL